MVAVVVVVLVVVVVVVLLLLLLAVVDMQGWIALVELMLFVELERNSEITYVQKIVDGVC